MSPLIGAVDTTDRSLSASRMMESSGGVSSTDCGSGGVEAISEVSDVVVSSKSSKTVSVDVVKLGKLDGPELLSSGSSGVP